MAPSADHKNLKYYFPGLSIMKRSPHGWAGTINKSAEALMRSHIAFLRAGLAQAGNGRKPHPSAHPYSRARVQSRAVNGWRPRTHYAPGPVRGALLRCVHSVPSHSSLPHPPQSSRLCFKIIMMPVFPMGKSSLGGLSLACDDTTGQRLS